MDITGNKFIINEGDKVVCLKSEGIYNNFSYLEKNEIYSIASIDKFHGIIFIQHLDDYRTLYFNEIGNN